MMFDATLQLNAGRLLGALIVVPTISWLLWVFLCLPVYRIFFGPLAAFPGPKLWAASNLPFTRWSISGSMPMKVLELHERYGPVVRIRPDELSFINAEAWRDLKGQKKAGRVENGKDPAIVASPALRQSILGVGADVHARMRRDLAPGFSAKAIQDQEPILLSYVDLLINRLREISEDGTKAVDLKNWFSYFTFDLIGDLSFGDSFGCLQSADYHPWVRIIIRVMQMLLYIGIIRRFIPDAERILGRLTPSKVAQATKRHGQFVKDRLAKRLAMDVTRPDFIEAILNNGQDKMSLPEIESNASVLIVAGSETSATALTAAVFLLCRHPVVLKRLTSEIRSSFRVESDIGVVSTGQLKYLGAVLEEVLRMYPPAPWAQPRKVRPGGDWIAGHYVPEETIVGIWPWAAFHSSENFALPDEFVPERWLDEDSRMLSDRREAFQPFSFGPRDCIGRNLAYAEMRLVLSRLLWSFDIELTPESETWMQDSEVYLVWKKPPLNVCLKPREQE